MNDVPPNNTARDTDGQPALIRTIGVVAGCLPHLRSAQAALRHESRLARFGQYERMTEALRYLSHAEAMLIAELSKGDGNPLMVAIGLVREAQGAIDSMEDLHEGIGIRANLLLIVGLVDPHGITDPSPTPDPETTP